MTDFTALISANPVSPIPNPPQTAGDFAGAADGAIAGHTTGVFTPSAPRAGGTGAQVSIAGWGNGQFWIALYGARPQNYFTSVTLGAPANLSFTAAAANTFISIGGWTYWGWTDTHEATYIGQTLGVTFTGAVLIPAPSGKGDIINPLAWETIGTGKLPPSEYDGIPGGGFV